MTERVNESIDPASRVDVLASPDVSAAIQQILGPLPPAQRLAIMQQLAFGTTPGEKYKAPRAEGKRVYLRNDSPGIRAVVDCDNKSHALSPSQAEEIEVPLKVIAMIERDVIQKAQRGQHNVLRIVTRDEGRRAQEGLGPPPNIEFSQEQNYMLKLAADSDEMSWRDFQDKAREVLGERYPPGRPSRMDLVKSLQTHGRGEGVTGG